MPAICSDTGKPGSGQLNFNLYPPVEANISVFPCSRVDASQTSKLGWSKDTFADTYALQLPKTMNNIYLVSLLEPTATDLSPTRQSSEPMTSI